MKVFGFADGQWIDEGTAIEEGVETSSATAEAEVDDLLWSGRFAATAATAALEAAGWKG